MLSHETDLDRLNRLHPEPAALLLELEQQGRYDEVPIVERATGRLLSTLVHAMQANRILEIGTAYGYSTLWMALAMPPAGHLWTIDPDIERTTVALRYLERAGKKAAVDVINQPALEILNNATYRNLDIIFIDADVAEYSDYLEPAVPMLKLSGLLIVDGLLTPEADAFNRAFLTHPNLDATILAVGRGIGIGARIAWRLQSCDATLPDRGHDRDDGRSGSSRTRFHGERVRQRYGRSADAPDLRQSQRAIGSPDLGGGALLRQRLDARSARGRRTIRQHRRPRPLRRPALAARGDRLADPRALAGILRLHPRRRTQRRDSHDLHRQRHRMRFQRRDPAWVFRRRLSRFQLRDPGGQIRPQPAPRRVR